MSEESRKDRTKLLGDDAPKVYINETLPIMSYYSWTKVEDEGMEALTTLEGRHVYLAIPKFYYTFEQTIQRKFTEPPDKKSTIGVNNNNYIVADPDTAAVFAVPPRRVAGYTGGFSGQDIILQGTDFKHGSRSWRTTESAIQHAPSLECYIQEIKLVAETRTILQTSAGKRLELPLPASMTELTETDED